MLVGGYYLLRPKVENEDPPTATEIKTKIKPGQIITASTPVSSSTPKPTPTSTSTPTPTPTPTSTPTSTPNGVPKPGQQQPGPDQMHVMKNLHQLSTHMDIFYYIATTPTTIKLTTNSFAAEEKLRAAKDKAKNDENLFTDDDDDDSGWGVDVADEVSVA